MFCHEELSRVRGAAVSETLSVPNCKKYLEWHKQAKAENINWQKLEALAFGQAGQPKSKKVEFKIGTKLMYTQT